MTFRKPICPDFGLPKWDFEGMPPMETVNVSFRGYFDGSRFPRPLKSILKIPF
jgi:hypothetical protein